MAVVARSRIRAKSGIMGSSRNVTLPSRYVLMAKKSHRSGERIFGQRPRSLGYGKSQKATHGRPRWITGKVAPIERAKTVITSAQRVTGRRQVAFARRRMAEIKVPAWLKPIQKTKFVM